MKYRKGDMMPLITGQLVQVEEILPNGEYKVILPDVKELDDGYVINVAIITPVERYVIKEYV